MKKWVWTGSILLVLGFLLCFPKEALSASRLGLDLWFGTLVPTLLPFLILSGFLIHSGLVRLLASLFSPVLGRLFSVSPEGSYVIFTGFLCGYPVGAKVLGDLSRNQKIHPEEARYLLSFCNNVSPSFVITFLVTEQLQDQRFLLPALLILYGIPLLYGLLTKVSYLKRKSQVPFLDIKNASKNQITFELLDACIYDAINILLKLGGYVILFSVLAKMLNQLPILSTTAVSIGTGILEITTGTAKIAATFPKENAFRILLPLTAFGGLCSLAQTISVLKGSGLSILRYAAAKLQIALLVFLVSLFL